MNDIAGTREDLEKLLSIDITRRFSAARERVFQAWIDPAQMMRWWGPKGISAFHAEADPVPGGAFAVDLRLPDGGEVRMAGVFLEVTPHELIRMEFRHRQFEGADKTPEGYIPTMLEIRLAQKGNETELTLNHTGFLDAAQMDNFHEGWNDCLDKMSDLLAA